MSIARALAMLGAGASGYTQGTEQARQRQRQEEDDAFRREQRDRQRTQWTREDQRFADEEAERAAVKSASAPVQAQPELAPDQQGPQAYNVGSQVIADPAEAERTVAGMNRPAARMRRAAGATSDPVRAAQIEAGALQAEGAEAQVNAAREAEAIQRFDRDMVGALQTGGWEGFAKFLSESKADGMGGQTKFAVKKAGENVTLYPVGPDGTALGAGMTVPDTEEGRAQVAFLFAKNTTPQQKLAHFANARKEARDQQRVDAQSAREERVASAAERTARAAEARANGGPAAAAPAPVWDAAADTFLRQRYTAADPTDGTVRVDGQGLQFGKVIALAQSQRNGGDTTSAIGFAFDVDNRLRAAATGPKGEYDAAKHRALREQYIARVMAPPADPAADPAAAPAAAPGAPPAAAPAAPAARPAPPRMAQASADPLAGLSRQQVREKRAELVADLSRWKGKPGAETRAAELQTLIDRIDNGQY